MYRNPFLKNLKVATPDEKAATYGGIAIKTIWFLALTLIGVGAFIWGPAIPEQAPVIIACAGAATILPFIIFFLPFTSSVLGSIYSLAQGYLIGFVCLIYAKEYKGIVSMALLATVIVFVVLLLLYSSGIIKVGNKFKAVVFTLFMSSILISGVVFISSFFTPVLKDMMLGDGSLGLIVSTISLVLAALYLLVEFDNVYRTVNNRLCKRYEWVASYGLAMTVVLLFIRILSLLAKIMGKKEN